MSTTAVSIPTGTYTLDPVHSDASFAVKHIVSTFKGGFDDVTATLRSGDEGTQLTGVVKTDSIRVRQDDLRGHLKSAEFFDVAQYPEIRFESSDLQVDEDGALTVNGELTVRGVTKPVVATGTLAEPGVGFDGAERLGIELETTVNRHDYGLSWNAPLPNGKNILGDDVTIRVELELIAEQA